MKDVTVNCLAPFLKREEQGALQARFFSDQKAIMKEEENQKHQFSRDVMMGGELWTDGLICAFELMGDHRKNYGTRSKLNFQSWQPNIAKEQKKTLIKCEATDHVSERNFEEPSTADPGATDSHMMNDHFYYEDCHLGCFHPKERSLHNCWMPIGWARISKLVQMAQANAVWDLQHSEFTDQEDDITVADIAAPYWERPTGPTWWCHVDASHPIVTTWLSNAQWLHPAISVALRDESKLISERMKHLLYEVPVRVAGGLLFELLGHSVGDPVVEDDISVVIRSWQAQNFLLTALHIKGSSKNVNVLGVSEVQELLAVGGRNVPQTSHEVIALLACRLARWDDRLFRKYIFGAADEIELKFMDRCLLSLLDSAINKNPLFLHSICELTGQHECGLASRRTHEDMHLFGIILNHEIRSLSTQVIRVKWSLHAREEIVFELFQHLKGNAARNLLEGIRKSTRTMLQEQEAVRARLFTIQDVMQSTIRAWSQDQSLHVQHNLGVFGGCGLVLSIICGLFGINVDGIPGAEGSPYAFALFSGTLFLLGVLLIAIGLIYLGLKKPQSNEKVEVRRLELQDLVRMFQQEAESHAQVRKAALEDS